MDVTAFDAVWVDVEGINTNITVFNQALRSEGGSIESAIRETPTAKILKDHGYTKISNPVIKKDTEGNIIQVGVRFEKEN